jgi:hypothetical protein
MSTGEILALLPKLGNEERREILDRLCALEEADCTESHQELIDEALRSGNAVLLQGVRGLLGRQSRVGDFLESPAVAGRPPSTGGMTGNEALGTVIDRYKLLEQIGDG